MENETIRFVVPVALQDVFDALAPSFEAETGFRFEAAVMLNPEVPAHVLGGARWSIAASNPCYIAQIVAAGGCDPVIRPLGRTPLALAVRDAADEPPTSSPARIASILKGARTVAVTGAGTSGAQFGRLLDALRIRDAVQPKVRPLPGGEPVRELLAGRVDLAALPLSNVAPVAGVRAAAVCPEELGVHIDLSLCLPKSAGAGARLFADRLLGRGMDEPLARLGLRRHG